MKNARNLIALLLSLMLLAGSTPRAWGAELEVETDEASYRRGETVTVTIAGGTADGILLIQISDPDDDAVWADQRNFDSDGAHEFQLKIPASWPLGDYTVTVKDQEADAVATAEFEIRAPPTPPPEEVEVPTPEEIEELPPEEAAEIIEELTPEEAAEIIEEISPEKAAEILAEVTAEKAAEILAEVGASKAAEILASLSAEKAAEIVEQLTTGKAAEFLAEVTAEKAAAILEIVTTDKAANILSAVAAETAAKVVEQMTAAKAATVLVAADVSAAAKIMDKVEVAKASAIVDTAVAQGQTAGISNVMLQMTTSSAAAVLVKVKPASGASVVEAMTTTDVKKSAEKVEAALKLDAAASAKILDLVKDDVLTTLLLAIAELPATPQTVATAFEAMNFDKVIAVVKRSIVVRAQRTIGKVFEFLTAKTLNNVFAGLTLTERTAIYPYLPAKTAAQIRAELLPLPDLTPTSIEVTKLGPLDYSVTATVKNVGNAGVGAFKVSLWADAAPVGSVWTPDLAAGSSTSATLSWKPGKAGSYTLKAVVDPDKLVQELNEANNELTRSYTAELPDLRVTFKALPAELVEGGKYTIEVDVSNAGGEAAAAFTVTLDADGTRVGSVDVAELAARSSRTLQFSWTPAAAKTYTLKATADPDNKVVEVDETNNAATASATVKAKPPPPPPPPPPFPWELVAAVVAILAVALILYLRLSRKPMPPATASTT